MRQPILNLSPSPGDEVKTTTCYMCACRCGIKVWLQDGQIRYIQGNPAHPVNKGVLCAKGASGIMQHYSPARLSKPLLRTGERGIPAGRDTAGKGNPNESARRQTHAIPKRGDRVQHRARGPR